MSPNHYLDARGKGEWSYDDNHDILFLKIREREYEKSIDFENLVIDIDTTGFATGIQLFDASQLLNSNKDALRKIKDWEFRIKIENNLITVQLMLNIAKRNRGLIQRGENFVRKSLFNLKNGGVVCSTNSPNQYERAMIAQGR